MRITVILDDEMFAKAQAYTGLSQKSAVIRHALKSLIQREASARLAELGGSQPDLDYIRRRRPWTDEDA